MRLLRAKLKCLVVRSTYKCPLKYKFMKMEIGRCLWLLNKGFFIVNKRNKRGDFGYCLLIEGVRLIQVALYVFLNFINFLRKRKAGYSR